MKEIKLTKGYRAIVDDEDFERLSKLSWQVAITPSGSTYAVHTSTVNRKPTKIRMHRLLANAPDDKLVDHKNGNGLDNRKSNLRVCTYNQNAVNSGLRACNKSGYKGVGLDPYTSKWRARITKNRKMKQLGTFEHIEDAAIAYNTAAVELYGEFAYLNPIPAAYLRSKQ